MCDLGISQEKGFFKCILYTLNYNESILKLKLLSQIVLIRVIPNYGFLKTMRTNHTNIIKNLNRSGIKIDTNYL